jgi:hypothetical protein
MSIKFTIGADPEFMLTKDGEICSAIGIVRGSKDEPFILDNGAGLQTDNVAVEFATPVCKCVNEFIASINVTMGLIQRELPVGYGLKVQPSAIFPESELEHPQAQEFGCSPDYNCWSISMNPKPEAKNKALRSFGGHVHIGYVDNSDYKFLLNEMGKIITARMCDIFLGVPSVLLDNSNEAQQRRELYGKSGCYRPTSYGIEYRVLSNFWTKDELLIKLVYYLISDLLDHIKTEQAKELLKQFSGNVIEDTINTSDCHMAKEILMYIKNYISSESSYLLDASLGR